MTAALWPHADSLPGPLITAELGDEIEITVNNLSQTEVVDIHWHGMPQVPLPSINSRVPAALNPIHSHHCPRCFADGHALGRWRVHDFWLRHSSPHRELYIQVKCSQTSPPQILCGLTIQQ